VELEPAVLDICVPVHNAISLVARCLASISWRTRLKHRLIIHDDASDQETAGFLEGYMTVRSGPSILIRSDRQCWFTTSVNRCLQMSKAPFVVVLNSDIEIRDHEWIDKLLYAWAFHGGLIGTPDCAPHPGEAYEIDGKVQGHLWFFARKEMQVVGLLDESNRDLIHIRSDDEWSARWRSRGYKTSLLPSLYHVHGDETCPGGGASWGRKLDVMPTLLEHVAEARMFPPRVIVER
jgi:glycosyltransferase involved in cell wall biosynthesis